MRIINRPGFILIVLLISAMILLTAYLLWKLPEAQNLLRQKREATPSAYSASQSRRQK
jgi:hypothetical protein